MINLKRSTLLALSFSAMALAAVAAHADSLTPLQWGLINTGQTVDSGITDIDFVTVRGRSGVDIGATQIRGAGRSRLQRDVVVAVMDSGVDVSHDDLKSRIAKNNIECDSQGNIPFEAQEDKDHNGFKGDCMGWNFTGSGNENRVDDDLGHGTHVAGIIAGAQDGAGIEGVATSHVKLLPIKVTYANDQGFFDKTASATGLRSRLVKAFKYAISRNVDIINLSMGWPTSADTPELRQVVSEAVSRGIIIVTAAGNSTTFRPDFPCAYDGVICVGAISPDGAMAPFSNKGGHVDLLAPGLNILSSVPKVLPSTEYSVRGYDYKSGTSQAAPFVSGAFALLKSVYPKATANELKARLVLSAQNRPSVDSSIAGLIQVDKAIAMTAQSAVVPVLKGDDLLAIDPATRQFTLKIRLKNLWRTSNSLRVSLTPSAHVRLSQSVIAVPSIAEGEERAITVAGEIDSLTSNQAIYFDMQIADGSKTTALRFYKTLAISARVAPEISRLPIVGLGSAPLNLHTIKNSFSSSEPAEFFTVTNVNGQHQLAILRRAGQTLVPVMRTWAAEENVANVIKIDADNDGRADYVIYSSSSGSDGGVFKLWYLDQNLRALYNFEYMPYQFDQQGDAPQFINWQDLGWLPHSYQGRWLMAPVFRSRGPVAKPDRKNDPFDDNGDARVKSRLYFVLPNPTTKAFEAHSFDDLARTADLSKQLQLHYPQAFNMKLIFPQSLATMKAGNLSVLMEVTGGQTEYKVLTLGHDMSVISITPVSGVNNLQGFEKIRQPSFMASSNLFLARTQAVNVIEFTLLRGAQAPVSFSYTHPQKEDIIIGPLSAGVQSDGSVVMILETKTHIVVVTQSSSGQQRVQTLPINRVTFLPGLTLSSLLSPVLTGDNGKLGLYMDASDLYSGHLLTVSVANGSYVAPVENSLKIPSECTTLDPVTNDNHSSFVFLCTGTRSQSVIQIPMK